MGARGREAGSSSRATVDEKGAALAARIERVAPAVYWVPSQSEPDDFHLVADLKCLGVGTGLACDCAAARHRRACAHRAAVLARRQSEEAVYGRPGPGGVERVHEADRGGRRWR